MEGGAPLVAARKGEATPEPTGQDRVIHTQFLCRGLSLLLQGFVRSLLRFYGCQHHHITPNGVLHIANFITLCECFLGFRRTARLSVTTEAPIISQFGNGKERGFVPQPPKRKGSAPLLEYVS